MPPFTDLADKDINPIEIYAYYLGVFINNMYNGIFLNYVMSFPNLPEAATGTMSTEGVSKKLCRLSETHDDAIVYIRIMEPSVIEYVTAFPDEIGKEVYLADPVRVVLGKE